ncbi:MAG: hypothetical protein HQ530_00495 [Parcubacteria group bacterium]|nr:hypothetical protein [Parcubacteria group bacterium]
MEQKQNIPTEMPGPDEHADQTEQPTKLDPMEALDPNNQPKNPKNKIKIFWMIVIIVLLLLLVLGVVFYFVLSDRDGTAGIFGSKDKSEEQTQEQQTEQTEEATKVDLSQYDGKVLKITSDKDNIEGKVWLTYDSEDDSLKAQFHALLTADLPVNGTCGGSVEGATGCQDMIRHEYAQKTISQKNSSNSFGVFLYPVLCNKTKQLDKSEWDTKFEIYGAKACGIDTHSQEKTSTFLIWGQIYYDSYEKILGLYDVTVYDSSQYWIETTKTKPEGLADDPEGSRTFELESEKSIVPENKVSDYVMEFKE